MTPKPPLCRIECDNELYLKLQTTLQFAITGQKIYFSDTLVDLVWRHCPQIYEEAAEAGFRFVPNAEKIWLEQQPPQVWFDVLRENSLN